MFSQKAIKEFKAIWKTEFDEDLDDKEALEKAIKLIGLFKAIYKPIRK